MYFFYISIFFSRHMYICFTPAFTFFVYNNCI